MMVFIFLRIHIYFIAIFVGNRGLQTLMLGRYVLYSTAFSTFMLFYFIRNLEPECFSLIPKTDTGLWLGSRLVQSTSSSLSTPGHLARADVFILFSRFCCIVLFFIFYIPVVATGMAVVWTVIMHLREFRLWIYSRYLLSPALWSPHHVDPRVESAHRLLLSNPFWDQPRDRLA